MNEIAVKYKHMKNKGLLGEYNQVYRSQSYHEILCNYYSNNPQPAVIHDDDEFFSLYPNFDLMFYRKHNNLNALNDIELYNQYHMSGKFYKLLTNNYNKIVFYTPPYNDKIGGVVAIHRMAYNINQMSYKNFKAFLYSYDHSKPQNKYCNNYVHPFEIDDKTIVVYPEVIKDNPLNAKNVVRWILLDLGYEVPLDYYKFWNKKDLIYYWEPNSHTSSKELNSVWVDDFILNMCDSVQPNSSREDRSCYMFRKSQNVEKFRVHKFLHPDHSLNLDNFNHHNIIKVFNKAKYFYSYDPNTFYNIIATLCGCITIICPPENINREQYFKDRILSHGYDAGIAYGNSTEEIEHAKNSLPNAKKQIYNLIEFSNKSIVNFLLDIEQHMAKKIILNNTTDNIFYKKKIFHDKSIN